MLSFGISKFALLVFVQCIFCTVAHSQSSTLLISGADPELEQNIRAHVSLPRLDCATEINALNRYLPEIRQLTSRAGSALGYYYLVSQVEFSSEGEC